MKKVRWTHDSQRIVLCEIVVYDWKLTKLIVLFSPLYWMLGFEGEVRWGESFGGLATEQIFKSFSGYNTHS